MKTFDVAIVGGGLIGAASALELARHGADVVLLDRQPAGREASWAAAGMLTPVPESASGIALAPLCKVSLALYPEFVARVEGLSSHQVGYRAQGSIEALFAENAQKELNTLIALHHGLGFPTEVMAVEDARALEPALSASCRAAAWMPFEASVDNRALTEATLEAARGASVEIREGVEVTGILTENDRCCGVATAQESVVSRWTVIAAGCFSGRLKGVDRYAPTLPMRGQMVALRSRRVHLERVLRSERGYLVPRDDGRILAGSTIEDAGFDRIVTADGIAGILRMALELAPELSDASIVETWAGLRPDTPDHLPILGPTDIQGLLMATGHFRNGILLAPITAQLVREWVTTGQTSEDVEQFSPMRFLSQKKTATRAT